MITFQYLICCRILEALCVDGAKDWPDRFHQIAEDADREKALPELKNAYLLLSDVQQQVLDRFLKDAAFSTQVASALAGFVSNENPGEELATALRKRCAADLAAHILTLLSIDNSDQLVFEHERLQKVFAMHTLLAGKSVSEEPLHIQFLRFGHITLDLLNNMCPASRMDEICAELAKDVDPQAETDAACTTLLMKILLRFHRLSDETLRFLAEKLLLRLSTQDIIFLTMKAPNSDRVKAYLHQQFTRSLAVGKPKYYYALSILYLAFDPNGFDTAAEWAESKDKEKILLGISLLGLAGWCRSNKSIILQGQPLCLTSGVLKNIQYLLSKDTPAYTIVANSVFDLYTYTLFDPRNLQRPRIIATALSLARSTDKDRRMAAEQILGLLPITTYIDPAVLHGYEQVFDAYICKESFDPHTVVIFKILTKLLKEEGEPPCMLRLKKLYAKAAATEKILESDLKFLELAREELFSFPLRTGTNYETYYPAFSVLMNDISSQDMGNLMMLVRRMHRDNVTFQANAFEASKIVRFLRSGVNPQSLSVLLENTVFQFDPHEASSYLITWLFYLFAHYKKPQAVTFYEKYADILNRPYRLTFSYPPYRDVSATIQEFNTYLNETLSRVEAIFFELLSEENNRTVAELFASEATAPSNLPLETRTRIRQLLDDSGQILDAYHLTGLTPFDNDQDEISVPLRKDPEKPLDLAMLYPDDLAVITYAIEKEKEWVAPLVNYAYRIDRVLAQRLIKEQLAYHYHMFLPEVRFNSETFEIFREKQRQEEEMHKRYGGTF